MTRSGDFAIGDDLTRPARPRSRREAIATIRDEADEHCAVEGLDVPTVARAVGVEAYRRHVDAMTSFGSDDGRAQAIALDRASAREADVAGAVEAVLAMYATSDRRRVARAIAAELVRRGMVRL